MIDNYLTSCQRVCDAEDWDIIKGRIIYDQRSQEKTYRELIDIYPQKVEGRLMYLAGMKK